jgi:hypothetical protein
VLLLRAAPRAAAAHRPHARAHRSCRQRAPRRRPAAPLLGTAPSEPAHRASACLDAVAPRLSHASRLALSCASAPLLSSAGAGLTPASSAPLLRASLRTRTLACLRPSRLASPLSLARERTALVVCGLAPRRPRRRPCTPASPRAIAQAQRCGQGAAPQRGIPLSWLEASRLQRCSSPPSTSTFLTPSSTPPSRPHLAPAQGAREKESCERNKGRQALEGNDNVSSASLEGEREGRRVA